MKKIIHSVLLILFINSVNCQVVTRTFEKLEEIINYYEVDFSIKSDNERLPFVDFKREEETKRESQFAVKSICDFTKNDFTLSYLENQRLKLDLTLSSQSKAKFISIFFRNFIIPEDAEMYILSCDKSIIQGPITGDKILEKFYTSNIIYGDCISIQIFINEASYDALNFEIYEVSQGFPNENSNRSFTSALDCQYDANCGIASAYSMQRDATGMLLINGTDLCSGAFVNNECRDFRPYFLTAFHCLDFNNNRVLSSTESNISIYSLRMKFEASIPTCPGNSSGNTPSTWIDFNSGGYLRADFTQGDQVLIEFNGSLLNNQSLAVTGWNNSTSLIPSTSNSFHHPAGDAKKYNYDSSPATLNTVPITSSNGSLNISIGNAFNYEQSPNAGGDIGLLEAGSSGSPLFNNGFLIGVNVATQSNNCNSSNNQAAGRFASFWTGNNTNSTSLSSWLDNNTSNNVIPVTVNSLRSPFIESTSPNYVCNSNNKIFTLLNPIPGKTLTWNVTNSNLFATTNGAAISGTTNIATLRASGPFASGSSVLTFTMTEPGCSPIIMTKTLWIGIPNTSSMTPSGYVPIQLGSSKVITLTSTPGAVPNLSADWTAAGSITRNGPASGGWSQFYAQAPGLGYGYATTSNVCGSYQTVINFPVTSNMVKLTPKISSGLFYINVSENCNFDGQARIRESNSEIKIKLSVFNLLGQEIIKINDFEIKNGDIELNLTQLPENIYVIRTEFNGEVKLHKIIVKK